MSTTTLNTNTSPLRATDITSWDACHVCGDSRITGGSIDIMGRSAVQEVICTACDSTWTEVYRAYVRTSIEIGQRLSYVGQFKLPADVLIDVEGNKVTGLRVAPRSHHDPEEVDAGSGPVPSAQSIFDWLADYVDAATDYQDGSLPIKWEG